MSVYDRSKCLELTTSMTLQAMQSGKLDAGNAEAVSNFFSKVYSAVANCAVLEVGSKNDAPKSIPRRFVSPDEI